MIWFGEIKSYLCKYTTQIFSWKSRAQYIFPEHQPIELFNETKENLSQNFKQNKCKDNLSIVWKLSFHFL